MSGLRVRTSQRLSLLLTLTVASLATSVGLVFAAPVFAAPVFAAPAPAAQPAAGKSVPASPQINAAVQEAIKKAQAEKALGSSVTGGSAGEAGGSAGETGGSSQAFSKLTGQGNSEAGEEQESEAQQEKKTASATSTSPSTGLLVLVFAIAALLLGGIAFYIVRDARGVAPVAQFANAISGRNQATRARKRRTKARAARAARKRNR